MISRGHTVQEIVSHNPMLALVLERYGVKKKFRRKKIETAVSKSCPDVDFLLDIMRLFDQPDSFKASHFMGYPIPVILDYLFRTHSYYVEKRLFEIEQSIEHLAHIHGEDHPVLLYLRAFFTEYRTQLCSHIDLEETTLFPYIKNLMEHSGSSGRRTKFYESEFAHYSLDEFAVSHAEDDLDAQLRQVRLLIETKHPEIIGLFPFKILAFQLDTFSRDLHIHELIEDEVLVPLARKLEDQLK